MHGRPCYEVEFSTGEVIVADGQHQCEEPGSQSQAEGLARRPDAGVDADP